MRLCCLLGFFLFTPTSAFSVRKQHETFLSQGVFPYVTAGNITHMSPEILNPEDVIPPPLSHLPSSTPLGSKGVSGTVITESLAEKYGSAIYAYSILVGVLTVIPFFWFSFAGGADEVAKGSVPLTFAYFTQLFILDFFLTYTSPTTSLAAAVVGGCIGGALGWHSINTAQSAIAFFAVTVLLNFLNNAGQWILGMQLLGSSPIIRWTLLLVAGYLGVFASDVGSIWYTSLCISTACSYGAVSGLSTLVQWLGGHSRFDFIQFWMPNPQNVISSVDVALTITFIVMVATGGYVNNLRYCQRTIDRKNDDIAAAVADTPWA